jgi:hypothetical protein
MAFPKSSNITYKIRENVRKYTGDCIFFNQLFRVDPNPEITVLYSSKPTAFNSSLLSLFRRQKDLPLCKNGFVMLKTPDLNSDRENSLYGVLLDPDIFLTHFADDNFYNVIKEDSSALARDRNHANSAIKAPSLRSIPTVEHVLAGGNFLSHRGVEMYEVILFLNTFTFTKKETSKKAVADLSSIMCQIKIKSTMNPKGRASKKGVKGELALDGKHFWLLLNHFDILFSFQVGPSRFQFHIFFSF